MTVVLISIAKGSDANTQFRGLIQLQYAIASDNTTSFFDQGTGLTRYDDNHRSSLAHLFLEIKSDLGKNVSLHGILNHTSRPESHTHFSQLSLKYKPIWSLKYRWQFKLGAFYPEMGFENPEIGWLTPYTYTNSSISSWIGEELRTIGGEFKVTRPGRAHGRSPHTFALSGAVYKGNDPTGTLLAFRGWALHDKQSLLNERILFAQYPSIGPGQELAPQAEFVEPFREIDQRWGYYVGAHWDYKRKSRLRLYFYDNNADDSVLARHGQYAWHTAFYSLAWQHRFNRNWRLISQYMNGNTSMGEGSVVVDFMSAYTLISYGAGNHRTSLRLEKFKTIDRDKLIPEDDNNGNGHAFTLAYRYKISEHVQVGAEYLHIDSFQANRAQWPDEDTNIKQNQLLSVLQMRF